MADADWEEISRAINRVMENADGEVDWEEICKILVAGAGAAGAVALTPAFLALLGFTSSGIAAGSIAAKMMAYFAALNGGGVAAGGLVALLQSIGAGGLGGAGMALTSSAGALVGWFISNVCNKKTYLELMWDIAWRTVLPSGIGPHPLMNLLPPSAQGLARALLQPPEGCENHGGIFYCT